MDSAPVLMDEKFLLQVLRQNYTDISFQDVDDVDELDLDFKGIVKIELLTNFTNLVTLNLNGNRIQKIQGLDGLVNLKWLHLSFNRIKKMEGLESLRKLEVLDLSNNRISAIENMDTLENLTHFAIRNNLISEMSNVMYLRRFKELYQVYFSGNPISEEGEYEMFIAAFLPTVRGLDKIRFDKETKEKARANYKSALDMLDEEVVQKQQDAEAQMRKEAELKLHKGQMMKLFKSLFDSGLAEHKRREAELNDYFSGQADTTKYYREKATEVMDKYDEQHDEVILKVMKLHVSDKDLIHAEIEPRFGEIQPLVDQLMMINSELTDNLNENLSTLDSCISEMVDDFCKTAKEIYPFFLSQHRSNSLFLGLLLYIFK
ncbi:dynein regulatory complex subunit 3-like [Cololabis saira]|uniref:dynein regulatory complex subunit 3-like n=1 Tax=Cololabis saira TaxID=129043 RepID=UPI002AD48ADD|nr:dynein regulatory complex subunit 3-like [Cololabis saira]